MRYNENITADDTAEFDLTVNVDPLWSDMSDYPDFRENVFETSSPVLISPLPTSHQLQLD
jgi:hypothetical protein